MKITATDRDENSPRAVGEQPGAVGYSSGEAFRGRCELCSEGAAFLCSDLFCICSVLFWGRFFLRFIPFLKRFTLFHVPMLSNSLS
jgi:hypothetical protein